MSGSTQVERVGFERNHEPAAVFLDDVRGRRRDHEAQPRLRPAALISSDHLGHADVTDDHQTRAASQLDGLVVDQRDRPTDEVDRHIPDTGALYRWRRQRHEPPADRDEALVRGQDNHLVVSQHRHATGLAVVGDREIERSGQLGQSDHPAPVERHRWQRPPTVRGDQRERFVGRLASTGSRDDQQ